jgi:hypothetical protein
MIEPNRLRQADFSKASDTDDVCFHKRIYRRVQRAAAKDSPQTVNPALP